MFTGIHRINPLTGRMVIPGGAEDAVGDPIQGGVEASIDHTWEGDDSNNRVIDLGNDYDLIEITREESAGASSNHLVMARAFRTEFGVSYANGAGQTVRHASMAAAGSYFQGKMTGVDANKIKLGTTGSSSYGTNITGQTYRLRGIKYKGML